MPRIAASASATGILLVLAAISSVQLGATIAKATFDRIDPAGITLLRLVFAAIIVLAVARPRITTWSAGAWRAVLVLGVTLGAMNLLFYLALPRIPVAVAVTLELIGPLVLALVQSRKLVDFAWVCLAGLGVAVIGGQSVSGTLDPVGVAFALAAGGCWAVYILASASVGRHVAGLGGLAVALVVGGVVVLPFGISGVITSVRADPSVLVPAAGIALLSSAIAYGLELLALRRVPTRVFGVLMALEPVAAAVFAFLVLRESLSGWDLAAIVLVVAASTGVALSAAKANRPRPLDTGQLPLAP